MSSVKGHLGCFRVLAIVNSASVNTGYMCLFQFWFPQGICLGWDCWVICWFYSQFFKESPYCLPQWLYQFTFTPTVKERSLFSTPSPAFLVCRLFDDGHSDWCEVIPLFCLCPICLFLLLFYFLPQGDHKKILLQFMSKCVLPMFSSNNLPF